MIGSRVTLEEGSPLKISQIHHLLLGWISRWWRDYLLLGHGPSSVLSLLGHQSPKRCVQSSLIGLGHIVVVLLVEVVSIYVQLQAFEASLALRTRYTGTYLELGSWQGFHLGKFRFSVGFVALPSFLCRPGKLDIQELVGLRPLPLFLQRFSFGR